MSKARNLANLGDDFDGTDLTLSGGVYLGGTGAANKLDDYEEGTWTPVLEGSTVAGTTSVGSFNGRYEKIGDLVFLHYQIQNITLSGASGTLQIGNLPFTPNTLGGRDMAAGSCAFYNVEWSASGDIPVIRLEAGYIRWNVITSNSSWGTLDVDNGSGQYYEGRVVFRV